MACELQQLVENQSADLGEEAVGSADGLVNRIRRAPLVSGLKQARVDSMLSGTSSIQFTNSHIEATFLKCSTLQVLT
jgi:hypothetical protein